MAANFPNSPNTNDTFTSNGITFTWNGEAWKQPASPGVKGQKGEIGVGDKGQKGEQGDRDWETNSYFTFLTFYTW